MVYRVRNTWRLRQCKTAAGQQADRSRRLRIEARQHLLLVHQEHGANWAAQNMGVGLKTQTWRTEKDVDHPVWEHWLVITVSEKVTSNRVFFLIGGGSHDSKMPTCPGSGHPTAAEGCLLTDS
jgi:hypothetical protein